MTEIKNNFDKTLDFFSGDELRTKCFLEKYSIRDSNNNFSEYFPYEMWERVSKEIASIESPDKIEKWKKNFYWMLEDFKVIPGGRIMQAAGNKDKNTCLINCFTIPIEDDSISAIYKELYEQARTMSFNGGVGTDISVLRPKEAKVNNAANTSTGSVSFMELISKTTGIIGQQGRRGACLISIRCDHPDILDFIEIKNDLNFAELKDKDIPKDIISWIDLKRNVRFANISVQITDQFMKKVKNNEKIKLYFKNDKVDIEREVEAKLIWDKIIKNLKNSSEPGLLFIDTAKKESTSEYCAPIATTNPCGEQFLDYYNNCNLSNINLSYFVRNSFSDKAEIDYENLEKAARYNVRFLDNIIDYTKFPLEKQKEKAVNTRRIGVGFTGLADMFCKLKIKYDTEEAIDFASELFEKVRNFVYDESCNIASEKGPFPWFNFEKHLNSQFIQRLPRDIKNKMKENGIRNICLLTCPPVGSGSILAGCSSGIEPIFAFSYVRRSESLSSEEFNVYHPLVKEYMNQFNIKDEKDLPDFFVKAHQIDPFYRVRMQATIQKYIDNAISSTINLPYDTSEKLLSDIYFKAWRSGLKGVTCYIEGSREGIMTTNEFKNKENDPANVAKIKKIVSELNEGIGKYYKFKRSDEIDIHINVVLNEKGKPIKVFVNLSPGGTDLWGLANLMGIMVSKLLQLGVDVEEIIRHLNSMKTGVPYGFGKNRVESIPHCISLALRRSMTDGENKNKKGLNITKNKEGEMDKIIEQSISTVFCPKCHSSNFKNETGCRICLDCLFSKCE